MLARWRRSVGGGRQRVLMVALVGLVLLSGVSAVALLRAQHASAAVTPYNATLLMVHGFDDTCEAAFDNNAIISGSTPLTTKTFFTSGTSGWDRLSVQNPIYLVGYYTDTAHLPLSGSGGEADCNVNLSISDPNLNQRGDYSNGACEPYFQVPAAQDPYLTHNAKGTSSDPIRHLGCLMAWYIWHLNLDERSPVVILAHSMGGLIVRDALGETAGHTSGFPPGLLDVRTVVTVGTPHGGMSGGYLQFAQLRYGRNNVPREVWDMDPGSGGSGFMSMLINQDQNPQGSNGTEWDLLASSVEGNPNPGDVRSTCFSVSTATSLVSCSAEVLAQNDHYPDGDGVVQANSALSMKSGYKALFGVVNYCDTVLQCYLQLDPGSTVSYSHEADTCQPIPTGQTPCLAPEFLLNDASSGQTHAWICASACDAGVDGTDGITDLHVLDTNKPNAQLVSRSLTLMLALLPRPAPPPPTPTATATPSPCSVTNTTSDIEKANDFDERGNEWHVYADVQRDATTNAPCKMRVVVRVFNPAPDGAWHGVFALMSYNGSTLVSDSGRHSGSGTYAAHFVWRGPWFNVSGGNTYSVKAIEYNGSSYNSLRVRGYIGL